MYGIHGKSNHLWCKVVHQYFLLIIYSNKCSAELTRLNKTNAIPATVSCTFLQRSFGKISQINKWEINAAATFFPP